MKCWWIFSVSFVKKRHIAVAFHRNVSNTKPSIMRFTLTLFALASVQFLTAQLSPLSPEFTTYVFGDKVNVRSEAQPEAKAVAQLNGGDVVTILEVSDNTYTSGSNTQPWYKVRFNKNQTGYVWGGLLSYAGEANSNGVRFAVGITAVKQAKNDEALPEYTLETRAFSTAGVLLSKTTQSFTADAGYYVNAEPVFQGALGLKGYSALLKSHIGYDACGYPWYEWYVLWDGKKLVPLPVCTSSADADVFYHTEKYLFPQPADENSQGHFAGEDQVFFVVEHSEKQYKGDDETTGYDEDSYVRARPVKWVGGKFVQPKVEK